MDFNTHHLVPSARQRAAVPMAEESCATYSTNEFAALGGFKPQTARKAYSATGQYLGLVPKKLSNKRLRWPAAQVQAIYRADSHE
jgi:hypothetical protein